MSAAAEKRKIVHLIATNFFGGPEKQIVEHLKRLDRERFIPALVSFVLAGKPNETIELALSSDIEAVGIPMSGKFDLSAYHRLCATLVEGDADLVCAHGYKSVFMGHFATRKLGTGMIAFSRGYTAENPKVAFYEWLERRVLGKQEGIVCVSEGQKRKLQEYGVTSRRWWVVRNRVSTADADNLASAVDIDEVRNELNVEPGKTMIVVSGRLSPEKGQRVLIEAIKRLDRSLGCCFVICGGGPDAELLEERAGKLGISDLVRFAGFRRDMQRIMAATDMLVLPSLTEGLPNVVLEAFSFGKPVVATAVGGVPELVEDNVNGILVPPNDPDELSRGIERMVSEPNKMAMMGRVGYECVRDKWDFDSQNSELEAIYNEVLYTNPAPEPNVSPSLGGDR